MNRTRTSEMGFGDRDHRNRIAAVCVGGEGTKSQAKRFMSDLVNNQDYLDIVVIGDSNAGYQDSVGADGAATGGRGYPGGWVDALIGQGVFIYSTGLMPAAGTTTAVPYSRNGSPTISGSNPATGQKVWECSYITRSSYTAPDANGPYWHTGAVTNLPSGEDWITTYLDGVWYNKGTYKTSLTSYSGAASPGPWLQYAYYHNAQAGGTNSNSGPTGANTWLHLAYYGQANVMLDARKAIKYRVVHAKVPGAGANSKYTAYVYTNVGTAVSTPLATTEVNMQNTGTSAVVQAQDFTLTDRSAPGGTTGSNYEIAGSFCASSGVYGPLAILWHAFYEGGTPGAAVHTLNYCSGGQIAEVLGAMTERPQGVGTSSLKTYLEQVRKMQLAAKGLPSTSPQGRVMIFINCGVNGTGTCATFQAGLGPAIATMKNAWEAGGGLPENLIVVITTSAPYSSWNPTSCDAGARAIAMTESNVVAISLNDDLGYSTSQIQALQGYAGLGATPSAHLNKDGYSLIADSIISTIANF